jgi:hypothetical protein
MNTGQIIKSKTTERFTTLPNDIIKSKDLTLEEKGLLSYLLSLPSDWVLYRQNLYNSLPDKKGTIDKCFRGLQQKGYIISFKVHDLTTGKFKGWNHVVYDISTDNGIDRVRDLPSSGFTDVGESAPILNTNVLLNTNLIQKTNIIQKPLQAEVIAYFLEKGSTEDRAKKAFEYYEAGNWTDSKGNKVKNWKQKMLANWINNNNFTKTTTNDKLDAYKSKFDNIVNSEWAREIDSQIQQRKENI